MPEPCVVLKETQSGMLIIFQEVLDVISIVSVFSLKSVLISSSCSSKKSISFFSQLLKNKISHSN
ncbi:hypothetical protein BTO07_09850 [Polaribacter sp. SA4-12]|nr:hypothetical protein BTO07_09850 [Polaribacter sp. SA4-12]